ncbi:MAG TPA: Abi family protein [Chitinophagales bacterium]|nr:Abi family protein [Chitinophagales bacterium]HRG27815.1 Abi family protein [Chitinophagales bacterium]HRG84517.1 Abi family protein [Chitinophagales bacterium]
MEKKPFTKPHLTFHEQLEMLKSRGLMIQNEGETLSFLRGVNYFRIIPYCRLFEYRIEENPDEHFFKPETSFEKIQRHYLFDRELKLLVFDLIEEFEIGFRTQFSHEYSKIENPDAYFDDSGNFIRKWWYEDLSLYRKYKLYQKDFKTINFEVDRAKNDPFIMHYWNKYEIPATLPSWMMFEVISMGTLSRLFSNLKITEPKKNLTNFYKLPSPHILENWLYNIVFVRNICAHHGRLWNKSLKTVVFPLKSERCNWLLNTEISATKLYSLLSALLYLQSSISKTSVFITRFKDLLQRFPEIDTEAMGFPLNWDQEPLWNQIT